MSIDLKDRIINEYKEKLKSNIKSTKNSLEFYKREVDVDYQTKKFYKFYSFSKVVADRMFEDKIKHILFNSNRYKSVVEQFENNLMCMKKELKELS